MLTLAAIVLAVPLASFAAMGWWSHDHGDAIGLVDGALRACGSAPNCVCSEPRHAGDETHHIDAIALAGDAGGAMAQAEQAVLGLGGTIREVGDGYLHATFSSRVFRFVDDVEIRLDGDQLQLRSASRVGYSDLGVNRARSEALRAALSP